jgi:ferredoxin
MEGRVTPTEKVAKGFLYWIGGCSNVCPTEAIEMVTLEEPVELMEGLVKTSYQYLTVKNVLPVFIAMISVQYMHCLEKQEPYILMMLVKSNQTYQNKWKSQ